MIPITANLASVVSNAASPSSSELAGTGRIRELSIEAPIAAANGASWESSALHVPSRTRLCNQSRISKSFSARIEENPEEGQLKSMAAKGIKWRATLLRILGRSRRGPRSGRGGEKRRNGGFSNDDERWVQPRQIIAALESKPWALNTPRWPEVGAQQLRDGSEEGGGERSLPSGFSSFGKGDGSLKPWDSAQRWQLRSIFLFLFKLQISLNFKYLTKYH